MALFESIIYWICLITGWLLFGYTLYFTALSFFSLKVRKRDYPIVEDKRKFCVFIPCHNEEDVIAATVENMAKIDYDRKLVDFYIIADNCSDATAARANAAVQALGLENFHVFERHESDRKKGGKPHALRWGIEKLEAEDKFYNYYDMFMIFDADNFADDNILKEINSQYEHAPANRKPCMIQCYLDSKNANNIVAKGYNYAYRVFSNRMNQLSKRQIGLNASIGGTGFAITMEFLHSLGGFNAKSLTEDLEMQTIANIKNRYIAYNPYARAYDEKPTGLRQSYIQKTRWSQGHWFVCFKYVPRLILSIFKARTPRLFFSKIDNLIYLFANVFLMSWFFSITANAIGLICGFELPNILAFGGIWAQIFVIILIIYNMIVYPLCAFKQDGNEKEKRFTLLKLPYVYICLFLSTFIYVFSAFKGLFIFPNQSNWAKTKHIQTKNSNVGEADKKHLNTPDVNKEKALAPEAEEKVTSEAETASVSH